MTGQPLRTPSREPIGLQDRAFENLSFIRRTMESSASMTSVPGWGGVLLGLTALLTAALASRAQGGASWLLIWMAGGGVAFAVGMGSLIRKARASGVQLSRGVGRKFLSALSPPLAAAAVLTGVLYRGDLLDAVAGTWLLLYGTAVLAAGAFSIRIVPAMGLCFMVLGAAAFLTPPAWADAVLALGFGGFHIGFGWVIARRHGG